MKKIWKPVLLLATLAVMVIGMLGSGAWWTDSATTSTNALSSGTLELNDDGIANFTLGTIPAMAPGDKTGEAVIIIQNAGTTNLAWFGDLIVVGDPLLKKAIYIENAKMEFLGTGWNEPTDNFIVNGVGAGTYPGAYNALAASSDFGVVGLDVFDGTSAMGSSPYEFMGALKPGYAYKLTLKFGFAELAGDLYQNKSPLNISLKVDATQVTAGALNALKSGFGNTHLPWLTTQINNQAQ